MFSEIHVRLRQEQGANKSPATCSDNDSERYRSDRTSLRDCVIVNDGRMILADFERNKVLVYTHDGKMSKSIAVDIRIGFDKLTYCSRYMCRR